MRLRVLAKGITELFETFMPILHSLRHCSRSLKCLQVFDEQRWLTVRGYDGREVRIESQLFVAGRRGHIVYIQTEWDG